MADAMPMSLFDDLSSVAALRCRMCDRPAHWIPSKREYGMYCGRQACTNRERLCQACGGRFQLNVDGAGTKYCSTECKRQGYNPGRKPLPLCAWCGKEAPGRIPVGVVWPYICRECTGPIQHLTQRLRAHKVPHDMARRLLDDPGCEVCGRDIVTKVRDGATGRVAAPLVVDHDHACCPGNHSCGICVRGFLCGQCNWAAGSIGDDPERARSLARYLDRFAR